MNTPKLLDEAISEANRFIKRARAAKRRLSEDRMSLVSGSKEMGAAKRASMDLTRILAELRR